MNRNVKKQYFVQFVYDEDPEIKKTFSVEAEGGTKAVNRVEEFCDKWSDILPEGKENYTSRVRRLRIRDTVQYTVPNE